jgi:hypothetical protein
MTPDPRSPTTNRIGLALLGLLSVEFAFVAEVAATRAFPGSPVTIVIADVLAAAFVGFALYCFGCALRGHVPRWYLDAGQHS